MKTNDWLVVLGLGAVALYVMTKRTAAAPPAGLGTPFGVPFSSYANTAAQRMIRLGDAPTPVGNFGTPVGGGQVPYQALGTAPQNAAFTGAGSPAFTGTALLAA
jgi:hypothetical protein